MSESPLIESRGRVRLLTLNRPHCKNAFNEAQYDGVRDALAEAKDDDGVACVVITGAGGDYTAGQDLREVSARVNFDDTDEHGFVPMITGMMAFDKPLIAAVDGVAVGVGVTMLPHCDLVVVGPRARFRAPFVSLGMSMEAGSSVLFPATIGYQETAAWLFRSAWMDADEAVRTGIAWRKADDPLATALEIAAEIAQMPIVSLVANKRMLIEARHDTIMRARWKEDANNRRLLGNPARREALRAFAEKRAPDFSSM